MSIYKASELWVKKSRAKINNSLLFTKWAFNVNWYSAYYIFDYRNSVNLWMMIYKNKILQICINYSSYDLWATIVVVLIWNDFTTVSYERPRFSCSSSTFSKYIDWDTLTINYTDWWSPYKEQLNLLTGVWTYSANHSTSWSSIPNQSVTYSWYTVDQDTRTFGNSSNGYQIIPELKFTSKY